MDPKSAVFWPPLDASPAYRAAADALLDAVSKAVGHRVDTAADGNPGADLVVHLAFPQGAIVLYDAAVAGGRADSAPDFMAFAADCAFAGFASFRQSWLSGPPESRPHPTLNLSQMRQDAAKAIGPVLAKLAPGRFADGVEPDTLDQITKAAAPLLALSRPGGFRHHTPDRFARLRQIRLTRNKVIETARDATGAIPDDAAIAELQTLASPAEVKRRLARDEGTGLSEKEVRVSYRVMLNRFPAPDEVARVRANHATLDSLRKTILHSAEFAQTMPRRGGGGGPTLTGSDQPIEIKPATGGGATRLRPLDAQRVVFLHVPKCGGTTLHHTLEHWFGAENMHAERFNEIYRHSAANLASSLVFSGHYDFYATSLIPGPKAMISFLRDPAERLVSLYNFHRAHTPAAIEKHNLKLPRWANQHDIGAYFTHPEIRSDPAIDNTMVRCFCDVPQLDARTLDPALAGTPIEEMLEQALRNLERFAFIGFMDRYEADLARLADVLGRTPPDTLRRHQVLDDMMDSNPDMHRIDKQRPDAACRDRIEELVRHDRVLYARARELFA